MSNKISVVIEATVDKAVSAIKGFKTSIEEAEGLTGKFKAGATSAFSTVKEHAALMAVGAGTALVEFGIKSVEAFQNTAIAARDLSTATGLSVEDASRWRGVAKDMSVDADTLTSGLGKIAKTLDNTKWAKYGIDTRDAGGHARDVNDILLDTFDKLGKITNETERARVGTELFGKGYAAISPLIGKTREEYVKMLGSVEQGQVITSTELDKAEKSEKAQKQLAQAFKELQLAIGQMVAEAAPALTTFAKVVTTTFDWLGKLTTATGDTSKAVKGFVSGLHEQQTTDQFITKLRSMVDATAEARSTFDTTRTTIGHFFAALSTGVTGADDHKLRDLRKTIGDLGKDSPEAAAQVTRGLAEIADAADHGDKQAQAFVKTFGLTNDVLKEFGVSTLPAAAAAAIATATAVSETARETRALTRDTGFLAAAEDAATVKVNQYQSQVDTTNRQVQQDIADMEFKWKELHGAISNEQAMIHYRQQIDDVKQANIDAWTITKQKGPGSPESIAALDNARLKTLDLQNTTVDLGQTILGLPPEQVTNLVAKIDRGELDNLSAEIQGDLNTRLFRINAHLDNIVIDGETHAAGSTTVSGIHVAPSSASSIGVAPRRAAGGPVSAGQTYQVLEGGKSELLTEGGKTYLMAAADGQVSPIGAGGAVGGGTTYILHVHVNINPSGPIIDKRGLVNLMVDGVVDGMRRGEIPANWAAA